MNETTGGNAFPFPRKEDMQGNFVGQEPFTLLDYFAGQVICGLSGLEVTVITKPQVTAELAYKIADAMLAEREKRVNKVGEV